MPSNRTTRRLERWQVRGEATDSQQLLDEAIERYRSIVEISDITLSSIDIISDSIDVTNPCIEVAVTPTYHRSATAPSGSTDDSYYIAYTSTSTGYERRFEETLNKKWIKIGVKCKPFDIDMKCKCKLHQMKIETINKKRIRYCLNCLNKGYKNGKKRAA